MCVCLKFELAFSTCLSPGRNTLVSSPKSVQRQKCLSPDQHKTCWSLAINIFVCSAISYSEVNSRGCLVAGDKCVHQQCDIVFGGWVAEAISLLAINAFVCSVIPCLEVMSNRGYLVASDKNAFVCGVIPCLEVSSRGYLVTSDDAFICSVISYSEVKWVVFENSFRNPPEARGKIFLKTGSIWVGMELKKHTNKAGMRKSQEPYRHYGKMPAPSLASNSMHLHP